MIVSILNFMHLKIMFLSQHGSAIHRKQVSSVIKAVSDLHYCKNVTHELPKIIQKYCTTGAS